MLEDVLLEPGGPSSDSAGFGRAGHAHSGGSGHEGRAQLGSGYTVNSARKTMTASPVMLTASGIPLLIST